MNGHVTRGRAEFGQLGNTQRLLLRGVFFVILVVGVSAGVGGMTSAIADNSASPYTGTAIITELRLLRQRLDAAKGELELVSIERDRMAGILDKATHFNVPVKLATQIYDAAQREGLDPELAFRLVKVESNFNPKAKSRAKPPAIGLAQVQLPTARFYDPKLTEAELYEPERNLRIGFRYLRDLSTRYQGDMRLALLAYNVGPTRLNEILEDGRPFAGKYASSVLQGYNFRSRSED